LGLVAALLLTGAGTLYWAWRYWPVSSSSAHNDLLAAQANARGLALLEWFDDNYQGKPAADLAIEAFEEAVRLAPDWLPARINLGIALLNNRDKDPQNKEARLRRAAEIFHEVLARDPRNPYAHFCLGIWHFDRGELEQAQTHFAVVTEVDPLDAHAWYFRGRCTPNEFESPEARRCFERALQLNPYLNAARHSLAQHLSIASDREAQQKLLQEFEALRGAEAEDYAAVSYTEMGRYATAIGLTIPRRFPPVLPLFEQRMVNVTLAPGTSWATPQAFSPLVQLLRQRFGMPMLWCDYNRDGRLDLFLPSAVVRQGQVGDILLENRGEAGFYDVSQRLGIDQHHGSLGGAWADFDHDGWPDLVITTTNGLRLLRNERGEQLLDLTKTAQLDVLSGVLLSAIWLDIDQDGDLDVLVGVYAASVEVAIQWLTGSPRDKGGQGEPSGRLAVLLNVGEARPAERGQPFPPLTPAFRLADLPPLQVNGAVVGIIAADLDGDQDIDIIVLRDQQPPVVLRNDRLLRFHKADMLAEAVGQLGCILDANHDEQSDFCLLAPGRPAQLFVSTRDGFASQLAGRFEPRSLDCPPLLQVQAIDLDLDGCADLLGVDQHHRPVWLRRDRVDGRLTRVLTPLGPQAEALQPWGISAVDADGDGRPDVALWLPTSGLHLFCQRPNEHQALWLILSGKWDKGKKQRSNAEGLGARLRVYAGGQRVLQEHTVAAASLGQSHMPLLFGLGNASVADAVQIRWPDFVPQTELQLPAGVHTITEINRKSTCCPVLFAWDGQRFRFVTDLLGAGALGEMNPDGTVRPPRPEESLRLEPHLLQPLAGCYCLQIAEPMDEICYLDAATLQVVEHPIDYEVYPDERFVAAPPWPTQRLLFFHRQQLLALQRAVDHRQRDVTTLLQHRDGRYVNHFARRAWLGFAEEHWIECSFSPARQSSSSQQWHLILTGWTDYAYPESIFAAAQAGIVPQMPVLEQKQQGRWQRIAEVGLPAGLPRIMTVPLPASFDPSAGPLRIRTNLQVYWDHVVLAPEANRAHGSLPSIIQELPLQLAHLEYRGFPREVAPSEDEPHRYEHEQLESVPGTSWQGRITRSGDVTPLLTARDDCFAIIGPGDALTLSFDASQLSPPRPGWQRTFILRVQGYSKDTAPTTRSGGHVQPLPFQLMPTYPYDPRRSPPPSKQQNYHRYWNVRPPRHP
jgi:Flp pilus assembly protein TadD